ncbi:MAG: symmetrical bis(5'-nucleosyl)-tetraphosphatase [Gammaproteobacteria bacterium]|nr:MAG: symmetrical bis(5'-nucleosyl)-tetraphosphatase [Gammaproteobacteria bacterium]
MSSYVIGDLQGCWQPLQRLLDAIGYRPQSDELYFVGDLINRGPDSLACLRWCYAAGEQVKVVLGNHDLAAMAMWYQGKPPMPTLEPLWGAPDAPQLFDWLCHQPLLRVINAQKAIIVHAGMPPNWTLAQAQTYAEAVQAHLQADDDTCVKFLKQMWGNSPECWHQCQAEIERLRFTVNALTRMRMVDADGCLDFTWKGHPDDASNALQPWFKLPLAIPRGYRIVFGHWAALNGETGVANVIGVDTGCVWGGRLTAYRLDDGAYFSVSCD